jgi:choloylglycine hydrolase
VVEFVNGKVNVYDSIGIMTNSPTYPWQITNLRNYLNLSPYSPKALTVNGITYSATGQGAGMVGLPGDISPPSRFAKVAFYVTSVYPAFTRDDVLNQAEHIINNVDIPAGVARTLDNGKESSDTTQWVVFKDLTHKILYFRTYNNMTLRAVTMSNVDLSEKATRLKMPISGSVNTVQDVTTQFNNSK